MSNWSGRYVSFWCRCGFLLLAIVAGADLQADDPPGTAKWTPERMMQVKRVGSVQVSPDGELVAFTVREAVMDEGKSEYRTHIHVASAQGEPSWQLTQGDGSCDDPQWSPDGKTIAFLSSRSGKTNVWLIRVHGGEARQLTRWKANVTSFRWAPDGSRIAFTAPDGPTAEEERADRNKDDARVVGQGNKPQRLHVVETAKSSDAAPTRTLTAPERHVVGESSRPGRPAFDWSPDGETIVYSHTRGAGADDWQSADLSLVEVASGSVRRLADSPAAETSPFFSPDGRRIAYVASDDPPTWAGRKRLHVVDLSGEGSRALAPTADGFGRYSELLGWHPNGDQVYFTELQGTSLQLMRLPLDAEPVRVRELQGMSLGGFYLNATRRMVGFGWETLREPCEAWVGSLDSFEPRRVSRVQDDLSSTPPVRTEVVRWKSTDGFEIEGLLTYPRDYRPGTRSPLLLVIHGGPMGAFTQTCDAAPGTYPVAVFAERSYAVLRANVRGSSGYGARFRYANYGDWGGGDFRDLMAGVDHLIDIGVADPDRLGVMGWSYGGYMTSSIITQTQRFRAASVGAGVTNLVSFTGTA
ncbi:MAG: prolyl oligopeptidase family serine peptidase, partial [Pirellulaceae bacterium]